MDLIFDHEPTLGIHEIFDSAQRTSNHERLMKSLLSIFSDSSHKTFILEFMQCLAICTAHHDKQLSTERVLDFAAKYCVYHEKAAENGEILLLAVFNFVFKNHDRKSPAIRFRLCEFVNRLLNKMGEEASLDDDIFVKMTFTMLERLQDKLPSIRAQAVMALQRLQDPQNSNCRIIRAFLFHMETDPSCEVRSCVVRHIAVTHKTLQVILGRLHDVRETVRKEAYKTLGRLKPRRFTIRQRQIILTTGLQDRTEVVKAYVNDHLIPNWFKICESNLLDFLNMLDVIRFEKETLKAVLNKLFQDIPTSEIILVVRRLQEGQNVIPLSKLTPESVTLWHAVITYLELDASKGILPELTSFAKYIKRYAQETNIKGSDEEYIFIQLTEIAASFSFSDEMGRKELINSCLDVLKMEKCGIGTVKVLAKLFESLIPSTRERMVTIAELISDIREPLETPNEEKERSMNPQSENDVDFLSKSLSHLNCESPSLEECIREERNDPETLRKCLTIVTETLKSKTVNKIDPTLLSLKDNFILSCFEVQDGRVQSLVVDAITLLCYWSLDLAKEFFLKICLQIMDDASCVSAVEAVFDLLIIHGFDAFTFGIDGTGPTEEHCSEQRKTLIGGDPLDFKKDSTITSEATRRLVTLLVNLLKSQVNELRITVCHGLAKLLLAGRLDSPIVLSHLIILWFSPSSESEPYIRQPLGMFFSVFSSRRSGSAEILLNAFSPTLRALERDFDLEVDSAKVAKLFIALFRLDVIKKTCTINEELGTYHCRLAFIILKEIRREVIQLGVLTKSLSGLELDDAYDGAQATEIVAEATRTIRWLSSRSSEKRAITAIIKFRDEIDKMKKRHLAKKAGEESTQDESTDREGDEESETVGTVSGQEITSEQDDQTMNLENRSQVHDTVNETSLGENEKITVVDETMDSLEEDDETYDEKKECSKVDTKLIVPESRENDSDCNSLEEEESSNTERNPSSTQKRPISSESSDKSGADLDEVVSPSPPKRRTLRPRMKK